MPGDRARWCGPVPISSGAVSARARHARATGASRQPRASASWRCGRRFTIRGTDDTAVAPAAGLGARLAARAPPARRSRGRHRGGKAGTAVIRRRAASPRAMRAQNRRPACESVAAARRRRRAKREGSARAARPGEALAAVAQATPQPSAISSHNHRGLRRGKIVGDGKIETVSEIPVLGPLQSARNRRPSF